MSETYRMIWPRRDSVFMIAILFVQNGETLVKLCA